ncbi:uncharacterized protein LOC115347798 [Aquila chrysaetos chrysaetos]|uniref:uncharacterized protein LOC115347798 n=1 Tax=Aquila chrysaetos chrysaetos TaxID=223781 RepID=UPI001176D75E|nr:uncharacterized protein LOC115347798 [Aquila chrysaetos chrysaetos]
MEIGTVFKESGHCCCICCFFGCPPASRDVRQHLQPRTRWRLCLTPGPVGTPRGRHGGTRFPATVCDRGSVPVLEDLPSPGSVHGWVGMVVSHPVSSHPIYPILCHPTCAISSRPSPLMSLHPHLHPHHLHPHHLHPHHLHPHHLHPHHLHPHPQLWVPTWVHPVAKSSKAITLARSESSCLPWGALQISNPSRDVAGSCWPCGLMGTRQDQPNLKSNQTQQARPGPSAAARLPSILLQLLLGEPSRWVTRGKPADELSLTCGLELHLAQQVQHPRGRRLLPIDRGRGCACPSQRLRPVLTDRSDERGRGWEATAAGGEREGAAAGGVPRARNPAGPAAEHHPSILPARGGCGCPASPRGRAGDRAARRIFVNIELRTVFGKTNC